MNYFQSLLLIIFGVIAYMMIIDENVAIYFTLIFKILKVNTERLVWMIKFHPNNFITTFLNNRKYDRIARELEQEFKRKMESQSD